MLVSPGQLVVIGISIAVGFVVLALFGFLLHATIIIILVLTWPLWPDRPRGMGYENR